MKLPETRVLSYEVRDGKTYVKTFLRTPCRTENMVLPVKEGVEVESLSVDQPLMKGFLRGAEKSVAPESVELPKEVADSVEELEFEGELTLDQIKERI